MGYQANPSPMEILTNHYNNPYFLHTSDYVGLQIVTDIFTSGADFHSLFGCLLNIRNKLELVDGMIPKPPSNSRDLGLWSRCNDMIATWLMNSISKNSGQSLLFM